jgi:hypothetical protein
MPELCEGSCLGWLFASCCLVLAVYVVAFMTCVMRKWCVLLKVSQHQPAACMWCLTANPCFLLSRC